MNNDNNQQRLSLEALEKAIEQRKKLQGRLTILWSVIKSLVVVAAASVLLSTQWFPVFRIYSYSMSPALSEGDIVVTTKTSRLESGDVIAFYYNNKVLVKRIIALSGDWVDINEYGEVSVNSEPLDEPYVSSPSLDRCDIELPYQVPQGYVFAMGDNRSLSLDSRSDMIGSISKEQIIGKVILKAWPLNDFGSVN